jgi:transcriptional regulator with XRE-family HTH domain
MFTPLDNKLVGSNVAKFRRHRDIKAADMAARLGLSETAYTKYERGETAITLDFLNKISKEFDVNPNEFLNATPENIVENIHDSSVNVGNDVGGDFITTNDEQTKLLTKAVEALIDQQKALVTLMEKLGNKIS